MAEVFAARMVGAEGFERDVVVKRVLPQHAADAQFRARFIQEARLAAQLQHPGIVQLYELIADGDELMMVMEHIDGVDLRALLKGRAARDARSLRASSTARATTSAPR
jgi:serine/threonine protein kinase